MSKWEKVLRKLLPYRNAKRFLFNDNFRLIKENRWREKKRKKTPSLGGGTTMEPEISAPKDIFSFHKISPQNKKSRFRHSGLHLGTMTRMCAINDTTAFFWHTRMKILVGYNDVLTRSVWHDGKYRHEASLEDIILGRDYFTRENKNKAANRLTRAQTEHIARY